MNVIYTYKNDCQDCYKCVRNCPVEAISMKNNSACIDDSRCISCGKCVHICPAGAQRYRNDEDKVKQLLSSGKKVILALAPAFASELSGAPSELVERFKQIGFYGVSETALGAQLVTYFQRKLLSENDNVVFSTACPTFVMLVTKYYARLKSKLSPLFSPLLAQCVMLRKLYGSEIAIVFAGPCIAKKNEADWHPELLDVAITFDELKSIMKYLEIKVNEDSIEVAKEDFIPVQSNAGAIYPLDGGMIETMKKQNPVSVINTDYFNYSGVKGIQEVLEHEEFDKYKNLFCEFLACDGGCINGSAIFDECSTLSRKNRISNYYKTLTKYDEEEFIREYAPLSIQTEYNINAVNRRTYSKTEKEVIWSQLGKKSPEDFIDCGACGYDTCDRFAVACLDHRAELEMCITSVKKQAQNKIKSFMRETPLGMCVVNEQCNIIECNYKFIEISLDIDIDVTEDMARNVIGGPIDNFFQLSELIKRVTVSKQRKTKILHSEQRVFDIMLFPFDDNHLTGIIIQDITKPSMKRDTVVKKAEDVIKNNLLTVQKIAFLLGETAAETEITLNEIINAYQGKDTNDG